MTASASGLAVMMFRQLGPRAEHFEVAVRGGVTVRVGPGDWLESVAFLHLPDARRRDLGPPVTRSKLEARYRVRLDDGQAVFRPGRAEEGAPAEQAPPAEPPAFTVVEASSAAQARAALAALPEGSFALVVDAGVVCPSGPEGLGRRLAAALAASGAEVAFAALNCSEPTSLPMAGESSSPTARLPAGRSVWEVDALLEGHAEAVEACPANPGAALLSPGLVRRVAAGERPRAAGRGVTVPAAFAWRELDLPGPLAELLDCGGGSPGAWPNAAERARARASRPTSGRPHVALYSTAIGAWGGVAVLLRLADELQALGAHAFVLHHSTASLHSFPSLTSPLKVRSSHLLVEDWERLVGADAFLIPSNWGAGRVAREVAKRHPGVVLSSVLQDREDRFENTLGAPVGMRDFRDFVEIGRGVAVSGWILDSAAAEVGLRRPGYRVIPNGVDRGLFRPRPGARPSGPVRVLAMWRPQTEVRRGVRLLRETFDRLQARFGPRVSLELFGWNAPEGFGRAPAYARHHGFLSPRQVGELMREVDVLLEPSLYQGFGLTGLEAMASGAVLCSTRCLGVDEYAEHGRNALVVPHDELPEAASRLVEDAELRARLREGGLETAPRFSWPVIGARWALYLAQLGEDSGSRWLPELRAMADRARERIAAEESRG